jgi:hypothetical protein
MRPLARLTSPVVRRLEINTSIIIKSEVAAEAIPDH